MLIAFLYLPICILGVNDNEIGLDGVTVATLTYAMGPGANLELESLNNTGLRRNLTEEEICELSLLTPDIDKQFRL